MDLETRARRLNELQEEVLNRLNEAEEWSFEAEQLRDLFNELQGMDFERTGQEEFDDLLERFEELN
jgi:hypothetical protein